ncbi:hypothetical protein OBBRIDRAFT_832597 [Obba rivulosa]|uniref:Uncharacterized protein n=1 Tax=Obba rivulosa TaxID=1052685 RepID=A0A8E2DPQ8_9APHY|nr:hypothetical protein OBBRIDRAFT_832597 [Obba rivulosa]
MSSSYLPHVVYTLALISLGMHTLRQRKDAEAARASCAARLSVLSDLAARLRARERMPEDEFRKAWRLARPREELEAALPGAAEPEIPWREVLFGKKQTAEGEEWDRRDWEQVKLEVERSARAESR